MPFALNTKKGTVINHPCVGELIGGVARPVSEHDANQLKNIVGIVVFDTVLEEEKIAEPDKQINIKE